MDWSLRHTIAVLAVIVISVQISSCQNDDFSTDSRKHPGFFGGIFELGKLIHRQYTDTTGTLQKVLDMLTNTFSDTATTKRPNPEEETTTADPSIETTTQYTISRAELGKILNKNWRGLQKLLRLELNDAFNQTKYNIADYKREYNEKLRKTRLANQRKRNSNNKQRSLQSNTL